MPTLLNKLSNAPKSEVIAPSLAPYESIDPQALAKEVQEKKLGKHIIIYSPLNRALYTYNLYSIETETEQNPIPENLDACISKTYANLKLLNTYALLPSGFADVRAYQTYLLSLSLPNQEPHPILHLVEHNYNGQIAYEINVCSKISCDTFIKLLKDAQQSTIQRINCKSSTIDQGPINPETILENGPEWSERAFLTEWLAGGGYLQSSSRLKSYRSINLQALTEEVGKKGLGKHVIGYNLNNNTLKAYNFAIDPDILASHLTEKGDEVLLTPAYLKLGTFQGKLSDEYTSVEEYQEYLQSEKFLPALPSNIWPIKDFLPEIKLSKSPHNPKEYKIYFSCISLNCFIEILKNITPHYI